MAIKKYKVLKPIALGGRIERGEIVSIPEEQAKNIGIGDYLEPVEGEVKKEVDEASNESGEYSEDEEEKENKKKNKKGKK